MMVAVPPAIAAGHPATAEAGLEMLEAGGSAADAAVAAAGVGPRDAVAGDVDERGPTDLLARGRAPAGGRPPRPAGARAGARARRRGGSRERLLRLDRARAPRPDGRARRARHARRP